jgi:hypothetical protein
MQVRQTTSHSKKSSIVGLIFLVASLSVVAQQEAVPEIPETSTSASQMTTAAVAFLDSLRPAQRETVVHAFTGANRSNWSNVPVYVHPRPGLRMLDLTDRQRQAVHALLRASLSSQGYQKVAGVMRLDNIHAARSLAALGRDGPAADDPAYVQPESESLGTGSYTVVVFGDPGSDSDWGWIIQGHHLGASFTVSAGRASLTPLFLGATPLVVEEGVYAGWSAMSHEGTRGFELMDALDDVQQAQALEVADVPGDVLYGVGHKDLPQATGLQAAEMNAGQQRLLRVLVEEYVRNTDFDVAEAQLAAIEAAGWDQLRFAWRGATDDAGALFYYRVQGERILIELLHRPDHIHSMLRDPGNDYGERWLDETVAEDYSSRDRFDAADRAHQN